MADSSHGGGHGHYPPTDPITIAMGIAFVVVVLGVIVVAYFVR